MKPCIEVNFVRIKIVWKEQSRKQRFNLKMFVMAFRIPKLFGTFEKQASDPL